MRPWTMWFTSSVGAPPTVTCWTWQTDLISERQWKPACWCAAGSYVNRGVGLDLKEGVTCEQLSGRSDCLWPAISTVSKAVSAHRSRLVSTFHCRVTSAHFRFHSRPLLSLSFQKYPYMAFFVKRLALTRSHVYVPVCPFGARCWQKSSFFFSPLIRVFSPGFYFPFISFKFTPDSNLKSGFSVLNQTYGMLL